MTDEEFFALQRQAADARALLESDGWKNAFAACVFEITDEWMSRCDTPEAREARYREIAGLNLLRDRLTRWVEDAKYESGQRDKRRQRRA